MHRTESVRVGARAGFIALAALSILSLVLAGALLVTLRHDRIWAPLGPNPIQRVEAREVGGYPTVPISAQAVTTEGRKCSSEIGITVAGSYSWISESPRSVVPAGSGTREVVRSGCSTVVEYRNPIPDEVRALTRAGCTETASGCRMIWRIVGVEIPTDSEGREGSRATWSTEPFALEAGR